MKRPALLLLWLALAWNVEAQTTTRQNLYNILGFENGTVNNYPTGWGGGPTGTIFTDNLVVHSGKYSGRLQRNATSASTFSTLTTCLPTDFVGSSLEWKGFFKTEEVDGSVALWMRVDGQANNTLAFATLQGLGLAGTRDWEEYSVSVPLALDARQVCFGFLLSGTGKAWVDDLQLFADGIHISSVAAAHDPFSTDHEFDQGSRISVSDLSEVQIENLYTLGKVWGFLKYHHPQITIGQRHFDYELFRILPRVLKAPDTAAANQAMAEWIDELGGYNTCSSCASLAYGNLTLFPDLGWISDQEKLGSTLSLKLQDVYRNRRNINQQFYVSLLGVSNPSFDKEQTYGTVRFPDAGFQLLALFRLWNAVQYFYPYRDVMADDPDDKEYWNRVLKESIPTIALAPFSLNYQQELIRVIAKINDTHANLWSSLSSRPPLGNCQFPVEMRFIEDRLYVVRLLSGGNVVLQPGDIIEKIDGVSVEDLVTQWRPFYADSNEAARLRDMGWYMTQGLCGVTSVAVQRGNDHVNLFPSRVLNNSLNLSLRNTHDLPGNTFQKLTDDVAYLKLSSVVAANSASYIQSAAGTKGLIIDLRNYPSEFVVFTLGQLLVSEPTEFVRFTYGEPANPGAFHLRTSTFLTPQEPHYSGKVVILIDEVTQSQAEYTTMAFRTAPGAMVIGSTTAGADGNVSTIPLPGGLSTLISGLGVFYPDGRPTQRVGIIPDIEVRPTIAGMRAGRDEVLEEAIRQIRLSDSGMGSGNAFTLNGPAAISLKAERESRVLSVGYASVQPGDTAPSGLAIFGLRQNDVLVSEAGVPATVAIQSGRIQAEMNGSVRTGLALANPNSLRTMVTFYFTDADGNLGSGSTIIEGKSQIAAFLDQFPFHGKSSFSGAFTFTSTLPVAAVALRGLTNERGEFLITTMPVGNLNADPVMTPLVFPHYADGGGWTTQIVLTNPSDGTLTGAVEFRDPAGILKANSGLTYSIPPRSSQTLRTSGSAVIAAVGSVRVIPATGTRAPFAVTIFSFKKDGITVSEAGVPPVAPGNSFRLYAEASGDSIKTGVAVVNTSGSATTVTIELFKADGASTGLKEILSIPANGQAAGFLNGMAGLSAMPSTFQGTIRVSSSAPVSVIGLRGRYNERSDFLMTTTPSSNESIRALATPMYFPHLAIGAGYSTQFVLFGSAGVSSTGTLSVFAQSGALLNINLTW